MMLQPGILALLLGSGLGAVLMAVVLMSMLLLWRHRENIRRLLAGTESKLGSKKK